MITHGDLRKALAECDADDGEQVRVSQVDSSMNDVVATLGGVEVLPLGSDRKVLAIIVNVEDEDDGDLDDDDDDDDNEEYDEELDDGEPEENILGR